MDTGEKLSELEKLSGSGRDAKYHWIVLNNKQDKAMVSIYNGQVRIVDISDDNNPVVEK
jgi:hypothetical protein